MAQAIHALNPKDDAIIAIRLRFLDGLEDRLAELETLFDLLEDSIDTKRIWSEIRVRAHRISGVAGSLGFAGLGARAAQIDRGIEGLLDGSWTGDDATLRAAVESLLDDIDAILEVESAA
ncbi:Hpt domain-containing protein [Roseivivax sp. CAU 1753]